MRLFLDANVLFSAAWSADSRLQVLFDLAEAGVCVLLSSAFAMDEARRNISAKRPERLAALSGLLARVEVVAEGSPANRMWASAYGLPPKDAPILAAARQTGADVLVTGDFTHFGPLYEKDLGGLKVLPPAATLALLLDREGSAEP